MREQNIYDFVLNEEANFKLQRVGVIEGYDWSFYDHVRTSILYKNSTYKSGRDENKPFKNITRPILNLQYRAEGFDLKDIVLFVNDRFNYHKSFLLKKYHEKWARENGIDTFIDEIVESFVDFGGVLAKKINSARPEVVPLQRLAFCDQTDILGGPFAERHFFPYDKLKEMESQGWGNENNGATATIDDVIMLCEETQKNQKDVNDKSVETPGSYAEIYEVHGVFPISWLYDDYEEDGYEYTQQVHIITFYKTKDGKRKGICLYKGKETLPYKFLSRDPIYGRALGLGGAEELFQPQIWTNYGILRIKGLLDTAAKIIYQTSDTSFANRNKTTGLENGEILIHNGDPIAPINNAPVNAVAFENSIKEWEAHAQQMGAANDAILGESPAAGTPFKLQELVTQEAHSLHEYRKGKIAVFLDEIYRDWIIPMLSREIIRGDMFLAELDTEEMQAIGESVVNYEIAKNMKERILNGELFDKQEVDVARQKLMEDFMKGNKKFVEILKDEFKNAPMDVRTNIAGKQKDLSKMTDSLVNVFRTVIGNPQVLQNPSMAKIFNQILESSGLDPIDFFVPSTPQVQPLQPQAPQNPILNNLVAAGT